MTGIYGIGLLCVFTVLIKIVDGSDKELIYVQAIWRHGDRAPNRSPYPNDQYDEKSWPRGWGQITNVGMMQMYELGQFFRQRYASFITNFNKQDVSLVSSKSDRAVVSALAMLRGFFPANGQEVWLENEQWQPIPFQVDTADAMLKPTSFHCQAYDQKFKNDNKELIQNITMKYGDFFDFLAKVTGYEKVDFKKASSLYNIQREMDHNMTQPSWTYKVWPQFNNETTIGIIKNLKRIRHISQFNSLEKARLRGGLLMEDWIDRIKNLSLGLPITPRKIKLHSAHEGTMYALMYALGVGNDLLVPYASCAIMEAYKTADNLTTIKFFYKNGTTTYQLPLPGCSSNDNCTITQLEKAVSAKTVQNLQQLDRICNLIVSEQSSGVFSTFNCSNILPLMVMIYFTHQLFIKFH